MDSSGKALLNTTLFSSNATHRLGREGNNRLHNNYLVACLVLAVASLLENSFVCIVHLAQRNTRLLQNVMFINHCVANILQAGGVVLLVYKQHESQHLKLIEFHVSVFFSSSVLSLPVMSVWRYIKTFHSHYFQVHLSCCWATLSLAAVWLTSLGVAFPPLLGGGPFPLSLSLPSQRSTFHAMLILLLLDLGPLLVMCVCNYKLFIQIKTFRYGNRASDTHPTKRTRSRESAAKWTLVNQMAALALCCAPVAVETVILSFFSAENIVPGVHFTVTSLALFHSLLAPILHAFSNKEIWREINPKLVRKEMRSEMIGEQDKINDEDNFDLSIAQEDSLPHSEDLSKHTNESNSSDPEKQPQANNSTKGKASFREVQATSSQTECTKIAEVHFEATDAKCDKNYRRYIATPSPKRMRNVQRALQSIWSGEITSSVASISSNEFHLQQYQAPHFTNYCDPLRSAGFRQVISGKRKLERCSSLHGKVTRKAVKKFVESRCSTEGENAMQLGMLSRATRAATATK